MAQLIIKQGDSEVKRFILTEATTTLGRSSTHDVFLPDTKVSREDYVKIIALEDGGYEIYDSGSTNPIMVNGRITSRHRLKDGDEIRLGDTLLIFSEMLCPDVEFLPPENMSEEEIEVASLDAQKTEFFSIDEIKTKDLISLQQAHQRLLLLYELGKTINSQLGDFHQLLDGIISIAFRTLDAKRGLIALVDEKTGELTCEITRDESGTQEPEKLEVSSTMLHKVLKDGVSILTHNALKESDYMHIQSVREYKIRSIICAPLFSRGEIIGIIYLDNRGSIGSFSEDDLSFLTALCHQAGIAIGNARLYREVVQENIQLGEALKSKLKIVVKSEGMREVYRKVRKIAPSNATVLITGETGTGKELVAKAIHGFSPRSDNPFIVVNCAAIPKELVESELFGYAPKSGIANAEPKGKPGKFELADGGSIFLDEIGEMNLDIQAKVLRVLREKEFDRLGGTKTIKVDVRVIAATNKNLEEAVQSGEFRKDLYYRLNVIKLELPPLRERKEDIIPLAEHFIAGRVSEISTKAKQFLLAYDWPGNVGELENCIERAVILGNRKVIQPEDLPYNIRQSGKVIPAPLESLEQIEKDHIIRVLRYTNGRKVNAVEILGITRQTLDSKMEKYQINLDNL